MQFLKGATFAVRNGLQKKIAICAKNEYGGSPHFEVICTVTVTFSWKFVQLLKIPITVANKHKIIIDVA